MDTHIDLVDTLTLSIKMAIEMDKRVKSRELTERLKRVVATAQGLSLRPEAGDWSPIPNTSPAEKLAPKAIQNLETPLGSGDFRVTTASAINCDLAAAAIGTTIANGLAAAIASSSGNRGTAAAATKTSETLEIIETPGARATDSGSVQTSGYDFSEQMQMTYTWATVQPMAYCCGCYAPPQVYYNTYSWEMYSQHTSVT